MVVKIRDLIAAEESLEAAEAEQRSFSKDPRQWMAFESLDKYGKRHLNVSEGHFEHQEALSQNVQIRQNELRALRAQFIAEAGVLDPQAGGF